MPDEPMYPDDLDLVRRAVAEVYRTRVALARQFGLTKGAVSEWGRRVRIPSSRRTVLEAVLRRPELAAELGVPPRRGEEWTNWQWRQARALDKALEQVRRVYRQGPGKPLAALEAMLDTLAPWRENDWRELHGREGGGNHDGE